MSVYPIQGDWDIVYLRKKASTAFNANNFVAWETNGTAGDPIEPADATDENIIGIGLKNVASTDTDYADNTRIPVTIPRNQSALFENDNVAGTLVVGDEGLLADITDATRVNRAASSIDAIVIVRFISATKGWFAINRPGWPREETYD